MAANGRDYDQSWRLAPSVLKKYDIPKTEWEQVWRKLWRQHALVTRKLKGLRLDVPFEVLKKTDLSEGLLTLASGLCGAMTFRELRKVIGREVHTLEEYVLMAEELAAKERQRGACRMKKSLGRVPSPTWLIRNGYGRLRKVMWRYPEAFAHLQQDIKPRGKSIAAHVRTADRLMKEHGRLPHRAWLIAHGHYGLVGAIQRRPDAFSHIHQENRRGRSIAKYVEAAERFVRKYGALPQTSSLIAPAKPRLSAHYTGTHQRSPISGVPKV